MLSALSAFLVQTNPPQTIAALGTKRLKTRFLLLQLSRRASLDAVPADLQVETRQVLPGEIVRADLSAEVTH